MHVHEVISFSLTLGTAVTLFLGMQLVGHAVVRYFNSEDLQHKPRLPKPCKSRTATKAITPYRSRSAVLKTKLDRIAAVQSFGGRREPHLLRKHADLPIHGGNGQNRKAA